MALQLSFPSVYSLLSKNNNLDTWKISSVLETRDTAINDTVREQYQLDEVWKEVIYFVVSQDEVVRHNYYRDI